MTETLARQLAEFAVDSYRSALPAPAAAASQKSILDTVGVALAGSDEDATSVAREVMASQGGRAEATVFRSDGLRLPAAAAAMVNGTMAHALDFDDTHLPSILHPSASVVPTVLAVAESEGSSGAEALAAAAIGAEITCRLGMAAFDPALRNSIFFERGLHATSICGTIGSAVAAALLMGADAATVSHTIGIAASMGAGLLEANRTGGTVKRTHCGWAAHSGISAARFAVGGLTGPPTVLEGRFGFFEAYTGGRFDAEALVGDLGERWEMARLFTKPYPTNHFTHAGIDGALALRDRGVDPGQITEIELGVPAPVLRTIAEPSDDKAQPRSGYHARFSGPFTVAAAFVGGGGLGVTADDFTDESVLDPERQRLAALVRCFADEEATAGFPAQFPAVLRVALSDGTRLEHRVRYTRGGPENPLSAQDLALKFRLNAEPVIGAERTSEVIVQIEALGDRPSVAGIASAL